jgi:DNA-binding response OmpR family regulator
VPFIFFIAFPDERIRAQALRAGAICYLTKPFDRDSLIQGLQAALKKRDGGTRKWDPPNAFTKVEFNRRSHGTPRSDFRRAE